MALAHIALPILTLLQGAAQPAGDGGQSLQKLQAVEKRIEVERKWLLEFRSGTTSDEDRAQLVATFPKDALAGELTAIATEAKGSEVAARAWLGFVRDNPDAAGYHARLAVSMAGHPPTAKQAEREFLDAVRLEPDNADLHYYFGNYYRQMKQKTRAIAEYQTALRLEPRHEKARTELDALSPRGAGLVNLRKLFR